MPKDITSIQAYEILSKNDKAVLVDTRTEIEWSSVGTPVVGNQVLRISSHLAPYMDPNTDFITELNRRIKDLNRDVIFICRSSARSTIAATNAEKFGYKNCYVVIDGFEGAKSGPGWLNSNLPFEIL
ncbi:MAG: rhodanese-like domain-containing protein [Rickettsiaceae bacterium]|nr:rhodanese-like domain-containing protein [Rickettsiaceae bacterium]